MGQRTLLIFGATGNLMYKKLIPALSELYKTNKIPSDFQVLAIGRRDYNQDDYFKEAKKHVKEEVDWKILQNKIEYVRLPDMDNIDDYHALAKKVDAVKCADVMAYLALPPRLFPVIAKHLYNSGIIQKGDNMARIVFEKPFGEDLQTAKEINHQLWQYFDESQIYRIDHYLGKDMIQNILVVRFGNRIFENTWNHSMIRSVVIVAKESESVMQRGGYYDSIGAIKDMLQSHLLQMAALTAMSKPSDFSSNAIKDQKLNVFKHLTIDPNSIVRGQYKGYRDTDKIDNLSNTETFVFCKATIDNDKWRGVPFYFITGKNLDEKRSEIIINFKDDESLYMLNKDAKPNQNRIVIKVNPDDGVAFHFNVKEPGLRNMITTASLDYCHSCLAMNNTPEAYEKLLLDFVENNKTLFTRWDEIEATWSIVGSMRTDCDNLLYYKDFNDIQQQIKQLKGVDINDL